MDTARVGFRSGQSETKEPVAENQKQPARRKTKPKKEGKKK